MASKIHQNLAVVSLLVVVTLTMISKSTSSSNYLASFCPNTTLYTNHSRFETNLNTLFHYLSSNATNNVGFYNAISSSGSTTNDTVYGLYLCRGDQNASSCQTCVTFATTTDLPRTYCPNRKEAVIWYDECMVRYSYKPILATLDISPTLVSHSNANVTGNATRFMQLLSDMMTDVIIVQAAEGGLDKKFATDFVNYTSSQRIYGLAQCTPDLSNSDCNTCLKSAIRRFTPTQDGRVLQPSCVVRYDVHPFFDNLSMAPSPASNTVSTHSKRKIVSPKVIVPVVAISAALLAVTICRTKDKILKMIRGTKETESEDFTTAESLQYNLETLQSATSSFSEKLKLGEGGFGGVYKGTLENGQEVAVKRMSMLSNHGVEQFKNEVLLVAKLQHRNLVRLLGYCFAGKEKLLVYEYVPNKSLDKFLFDPKYQRLLDWSTRYKIIGGIGRGLLYLHQDSRLRIIHRDLKAGNILLDAEMNPKIADFGTARIFGIDQTQGNTLRVIGTYGYMSPEYALHGEFSTRSDVYSFGVLVLEIISGKRIRTGYKSEDAEDLQSYAWKQWKNGTPLEFVDPSIVDSCSRDEVMRCIHLGLLCVQECVDDRPTMASIILALDSHAVNLPEPQEPSIIVKSRTESSFEDFVSSQSISNSTKSVNEVSITVMEPMQDEAKGNIHDR